MALTDKNCIFCKIAQEKIPAIKIYEDEKVLVIMDKFPVMRGQTLVISKNHEPYLFNLNNDNYNHMFNIAKKIVLALDKALIPKRTCLVVEGFEVPHSHIKLFPVHENHLILQGAKEVNDKELRELAEKIKSNL